MLRLPKWEQMKDVRATGYKLHTCHGTPGVRVAVKEWRRRDHLKTVVGDLVRARLTGTMYQYRVDVYYKTAAGRTGTCSEQWRSEFD